MHIGVRLQKLEETAHKLHLKPSVDRMLDWEIKNPRKRKLPTVIEKDLELRRAWYDGYSVAIEECIAVLKKEGLL